VGGESRALPLSHSLSLLSDVRMLALGLHCPQRLGCSSLQLSELGFWCWGLVDRVDLTLVSSCTAYCISVFGFWVGAVERFFQLRKREYRCFSRSRAVLLRGP
jgi:hypothetical protein